MCDSGVQADNSHSKNLALKHYITSNIFSVRNGESIGLSGSVPPFISQLEPHTALSPPA